MLLTFDVHQVRAVADCQQEIFERRIRTFRLYHQVQLLHNAIVLRQTTYWVRSGEEENRKVVNNKSSAVR